MRFQLSMPPDKNKSSRRHTMVKNIRLLATTLLLGAALSGCGSDDELRLVTPGDQPTGGIWVGTWTGPSGGQEDVVAFSTDIDPDSGEARFEALILSSLIRVSGTVQVDGALITGTATAYTTEPGDTFPGGSTTTGLTFAGTLQGRATLDADWLIDAGESGSFSVAYNEQHLRGADLTRLDDNWVDFDIDGNRICLPFDPECTIVGPLNIMNGMIFRQTPACTTTGTITIPDPAFNMYEWNSTISDTSPNECPIKGQLTGLGVLTDFEADGLVFENDEFDVLASNPGFAGYRILVRESSIPAD
jgi:hypothetical protein